MQIQLVYDKYFTPINLQHHMRRVAAVAKTILDHWSIPFDHYDDVVNAALVHDIAKPVAFDIAKQSKYIEDPAELEKAVSAITTLRKKYGTTEHEALLKICREIDLSDEAVRIVDKGEWEELPILLEKNDIPTLLLVYSDMRIGTKGLEDLDARFQDLWSREPSKEAALRPILALAHKLDKLIQGQTEVKLTEIKAEQIEELAKEFI